MSFRVTKVAKLEKRKLSINPKTAVKPSKPNTNAIYSLALNVNNKGSPSPQSAHAYTMTLLFNALEDGPIMSNYEFIRPAMPVHMESTESMRQHRIDAMTGVKGKNQTKSSIPKHNAKSTTAPSISSSSTLSTNNKKKVTTAASFFGTVTSKPSTVETKSATEQKSSSVATTSDSKSSDKKITAASTKKETKEKSLTSHKREKGTVDDFVGDEDEDEDFLEEEKERKERNALREHHMTKQRNKTQKIVISNDVTSMDIEDEVKNEGKDEDDDKVDMEEEKEEKRVITGAIDAFATTKKELDGVIDATQNGRKRRKQVLEERTFVDENGFFRTETVSIWKDVDEDEKQTSQPQGGTKSSTKASVVSTKSIDTKQKQIKNTKGMKQQGLKGFFAAKK